MITSAKQDAPLNQRVTLLVVTLLAAALAWPNAAQAESDRTLDLSTPKQRTEPSKSKQETRPRSSTSCAEFGAGFVRLPGSDSCVRVGGGVDVGVGR